MRLEYGASAYLGLIASPTRKQTHKGEEGRGGEKKGGREKKRKKENAMKKLGLEPARHLAGAGSNESHKNRKR